MLFSTARLHISDTDTWLRVPDGWVLEKSSANVCPNLIPVTMTQLMESNRKSARPIQKKIGLMNMRKEQLLSKENVISGAQNRVEKILALQRQVESMAATILTVQESIVITQCFISRLLEGKL